MRRVSLALTLGVVALGATVLLCTSLWSDGWLAVFAMVAVGLMNSIMFPTIFTLAIEGLGEETARGSALLVMAIVGGALVPMLQGWCADQFGLRPAFVIPLFCYAYIVFFALRCHRSRVHALPAAAAMETHIP